MKFSIRFADKIVGALVILAVAILIAVIFMLGKNQRWFAYDYKYVTKLSSGAGLSRNMAVQHKGFTIGHVKDFVLADDDNVEVLFTIFEEYNSRVREGSLVEVNVSPIGLGSSFVFYPGRGERQLDEGSIIYEVNSTMGKQMIVLGMASKEESTDGISNIMNQVNMLLETINLSLSGDSGSEGMPLAETLRNIEELTRVIADPNGTVVRLLDGNGPVYNDLVKIIDSLSGIMNDVDRSTHVLPAQLPTILSNLNSGLLELQDVIIALSNNPLLRGGIPQRAETGPGGAGTRDLEF